MGSFIDGVLARLGEIFGPDAVSAVISEWLANLVVGVVTFAVFYVGWLIVDIILRTALRRSGADDTTSSFAETLVKYAILTIGVVTALDAAGIQTSAVLASLGIVSLTIGFAARDFLSNVISGILIFLDRPFVIGDLVEVEDVYGRVERITLRSTRIVTKDGKMLAVPNTEVINKIVASYTNFPHLRLDIPVSVAVTEDLGRARRILLDLVHDNPDYLADPAPKVVVSDLGDYSVTLELQAWLRDERQHIDRRFELRERVFEALIEAGVVMPLETIQLAPVDVKVERHARSTAQNGNVSVETGLGD